MSKAHPHKAHCREEPRGAELLATVWRSRRYSFTTNRKTQRRKTKTIRFSRNAMSRFVLRGQRLVVMPAAGASCHRGTTLVRTIARTSALTRRFFCWQWYGDSFSTVKRESITGRMKLRQSESRYSVSSYPRSDAGRDGLRNHETLRFCFSSLKGEIRILEFAS